MLLEHVLRRRSEKAFNVLYDRHTTYLWRMALRLSAGDSGRAEEVLCDAWVRAIARLGAFEGRSSLRTWLAGFVVNVSREMSRADLRAVELEEAREPIVDIEPAATSRVDLDRALSRLSPGYRRVLVLHDVEGFTHEEIATMLGVAPGTSKSQLSRARQKVREMLTD